MVPKKIKTMTKTKTKVAGTQAVPDSAQIDPDTIQSPVRDLLRSHGLSLDSIFKSRDVEDYASGIRDPPQHRIPVSHTQSVADDASLCLDDEWETESHDPEVGVRKGTCTFRG